ncbi:MAG: ferritin-like domain-containing protein [Sandaracinus sp.]
MNEPEIHVENRESLAYLLAEASEIEHGLMCCYLYAAFSLREQPAHSEKQRDAIARWRKSITEVAKDEMIHLALVSNVANAIGVAPHFGRQNFPVGPGYHPAGVVVSLAPFGKGTIDHFVFLERPEGVDVPDGDGFAPALAYVRAPRRGRLVPSAQDYGTVGHLYRAIERGLAQLAERLGEQELFSGDPRLQVDTALVGLAQVTKVVDLASAVTAIETIVTQGEGARDADATSHYRRFVAIRDELAALQAEDPSFEPAAGVAWSPVMRKPPKADGLVWVDREPTASVLDTTNALYGLALRALGVMFAPASLHPGARELAADTMATAMMALTPLARLLCTLPASTTIPDVTAGLTFTMTRNLEPMPEMRGAFRALHEAAAGVASAIREHVLPIDGSLARLATTMDELAVRLRDQSRRVPVALDAPVAPVAAASAPTSTITDGVEEVRGEKLVLRFEGQRCIHARHCVTATPGVFLANVKGPWIHPDAAPIDDVVSVARACPSGAITYERLDGGEPERPPPRNVVRVRENGPYAFAASLKIRGQPDRIRATLCRCGASQKKPYCDGSHVAAGFTATGEPPTRPSEPLHDGAPLEVRPQPDGPLALTGPVEICSGTGRTVDRPVRAFLCRCGGSANKPFCDGTHAKIGFRAP